MLNPCPFPPKHILESHEDVVVDFFKSFWLNPPDFSYNSNTVL